MFDSTFCVNICIEIEKNQSFLPVYEPSLSLLSKISWGNKKEISYFSYLFIWYRIQKFIRLYFAIDKVFWKDFLEFILYYRWRLGMSSLSGSKCLMTLIRSSSNLSLSEVFLGILRRLGNWSSFIIVKFLEFSCNFVVFVLSCLNGSLLILQQPLRHS